MAAKVTSDSPPSKRICLSHEAQPSNNHLLYLPVELLEKIYQFLDPKSALALSLTYRTLRQIFTSDEISKHFITQYFKVKLSPDMPHSEQLSRLIAFHLGKSSPTPKATLTGDNSRVTSLAMTPDGSKVISGSKNGTLRIWNAKTKQCLHTLRQDRSAIFTIKISPDGSKAISAPTPSGADWVIRLWNIETGEHIRIFRGGFGWLLDFFSDGSKAISGGPPIRIWDVETGECLRVLDNPPPPNMFALAITPDDSKLMSVSESSQTSDSFRVTLYIHDLTTGELLRTFPINSLAPTSESIYRLHRASLFPNFSKGVLSYNHTNGPIQVWDSQTGAILKTMAGHDGSEVSTATLTADGSKVISSAWDDSIRVSDLATGRTISFSASRVITPGEGYPVVNEITLSSDGLSAYFAKGNEILEYDLTALPD